MNDDLWNLFSNPSILSGFFSWCVAQGAKMLCTLVSTGRFNIGYFMSTGGMPSAHSAMAGGLATSVGLRTGFYSPTFAITVGFAAVVMFDAQSVRRAAGQQARIVNQILDDLRKHHTFPEQKKLAELLGHSRLEVLAGFVMGVLTALLVHAFPMLRLGRC